MVITIRRRLLLFMAPFLLLEYGFGYPDLHTFNIGSQGSEIQAAQVKRNAPTDQLEEFLKHSSIISRIANGITLQAGLMKGSIPIDEAVGELLNFGSVKVPDLVKFEKNSLNDVIEKLRSLSKDIDSGAKDLEDVALKWNQLRIDSEAAKDAKEPPRKKEYFDSLGTFNTDFGYSLLQDANDHLGSLMEILNKFEKAISKGTPDATVSNDLFMRGFIGLPTDLTNVHSSLEKLDALVTTINSHKVLEESANVFKPLQEAISLQKVRKGLTVKSTQDKLTTIENNFQKAFDLASAAKTSLPQTVFMKDLADFRVNSKPFQRKLTSAFWNGKPDMDELFAEIQSKWIETVSRGNITQIILSQSLSPLSHFRNQLAETDKVLGSKLDKQSYACLVKMKALQEKLSAIKQESVKSGSVMTQIEVCNEKGLEHFKSSESVKIMNGAKKLGVWLGKFKGTIKKLDLDKLKTDLDAFKNSIGFTDWKDVNGSPSEVPQALENLKANNVLTNFKSMINGIKSGISVDVKTLQDDIAAITNGKDKLSTFTGLDQELSIHTCLHDLKDQSVLLAHAIKTTQELKRLDTSNVDNFENVVNVVADVSKKLGDVQSIPAGMVKAAHSLTNDTNRLPKQVSDVIGVVVNSLRSAHELKKLETTQLKQIDNVVKNELKTVTNSQTKQSIQSGWGNHDLDMTALDVAIKSIGAAEGNMSLPTIKFINQFGKPFLELEQLSDVKIDTKSKIQALDLLIPISKNSKKELEKSKATLETIDSLDLQFSSHKTQYQQASDAFQRFYQFFVDITTVQKQANPPSVIYSGGPNGAEEQKPDIGVLIGSIGGGTLLVGGVIAGLLTFYFKYWRHRVDKEALRRWIRKQEFPDNKDDPNQKYVDAYRMHEAYMRAMEIYCQRVKLTFEYLPAKKHRGPNGVNPETALHHLKRDGVQMPIHANWVVSPNGKKFIATQAPIFELEGREDTMEDFWHMCILEDVEYIVMLCAADEKRFCLYYPTKLNKTVTFGRYQVKLIAEGKLKASKQVEFRKLRVTDTTSKFKKPSVFTHYAHTTWPDMKPPVDGKCGPSYAIMKIVEKSKTPVVVHCMSGIGRTMAFIGVYTTSEAVKLNPKLTMGDALAQLREARWYAVQTIRQSYWLQVAVCDKLNKDYKLGMNKEIASMLATFHAVAFEDCGPPEVMEPRIKEKANRKDGIVDAVDIKKDKKEGDFGVFIMY